MDRLAAVKEAVTSAKGVLTWQERISEDAVTPKVAIYCRVSSVKQANEDTIAVQLATCHKLLAKHFGPSGGESLVGIYQDEAYNLEQYESNRNFWRLMQDVKDGRVNRVIISSESRIFRGSSSKLRGSINDILREARAVLISSEGESKFKPSHTTDRIKLAVTQELGAINKIEMVRTLQNARRTRLEEEKNFRPSIHPYGYRLSVQREGKRKVTTYLIHTDEAAIVHDIFALYTGQKPKTVPAPDVSGPIGIKRIAGLLNESGYNKQSYLDSLHPGQAAAVRLDFTPMGITHIIRNPAYMGNAVVFFKETDSKSVYDGSALLQKIPVPAIITEETYVAAQRIREGKSSIIKAQFETSAQGRNWLHASVRCIACGWPLRGFTSSKGDRYYGCPRKKVDDKEHRTIRAEDLEQAIQKRLFELFDKNFSMEGLLAALNAKSSSSSVTLRDEQSKLLKSRAQLQDKLARLIDGFTDGIIPRDAYLAKKAVIDADSLECDKRLGEIEAVLGGEARKTVEYSSRLADIKRALEKLKNPESRQSPAFLRLLLKASVDRIELLPVTRPAVEGMSTEEVQEAFRKGLIVPKDLTQAGWSWRRISSLLGKSGRKTPLDFKIRMTWINNMQEEIQPF